jgi:hypothetical protein
MLLLRRRTRNVARSAIDLQFRLGWLILWLAATPAALSADEPETLLPTNTVAALATPDFSGLRQAAARAPLTRLWNDPCMAAFTARAGQSWSAGFAAPVANMMGASWTNLLNLCQGQVALAFTGGTNAGTPGGIVLLIDSANRAGDLGAFLSALAASWTNSGNSVRSEEIATQQFLALAFPRQNVPQTIRDFFPRNGSAMASTTNLGPFAELLAGRINSWLILGTRKADLEQVCSALSGTRSTPSFARQFGTNHPVILPHAILYSWIDATSLLGVLARNYPLPPAGAVGPTDDITPETLIKATGLGKIRNLFFSAREASGGLLYQMTWAVPEAERQGIVRLLAAESKPCTPLPFVSPDAVEFDRWRVDGRKAWATLQQIFTGISPHWTNSAALILETANAAARLKDPTFDINTNLFGNLGDDIIIMERPPLDFTPEAVDSPPALYLLGSPNPPQLAAALSSIFIFLDREAETPKTREFAGVTIRSVPLPALPFAASQPAAGPTPRRLHYAPAQGYVALSTDSAFLEHFLQTTNPPASNILAQADFPTAAQQVVDPATGLFGFNHRLNLMRSLWPAARNATNSMASSVIGFDYGFLPGLIALVLPANSADWFDLKLLPPANSVEKYFHYTVYGGTASTNGITWKMFEPTPPGLK